MENELFYIIHNMVASASLGYCRMAPIFFLVPFFSSGNIPGVVRLPVIVLVAIGVSPFYSVGFSLIPIHELLFIMAREVIIGVLLGCLLASPFWIFQVIGSFIDNQRGATLSSTLDPATGVDTSELSKFFSLFSAVVYLNNGGMKLILETIHRSYEICEPFGHIKPNLYHVTGFLNFMMTQGIIHSSPVIAVMLGAEVLLGLLSRFASQLNAFSISLTIKSGLAFLILLIYFSPVLSEKVMSFSTPVNLLKSYFLGVN
uniref:type III secretion system export apparatus subunit SctT n=1 Tax=Yersinia frederiksenii TaxID=29484 RepID=UPI001F4C4102|nr:type III secretion system export apparatus subunit SctT [Yersinia frederiksenii]